MFAAVGTAVCPFMLWSLVIGEKVTGLSYLESVVVELMSCSTGYREVQELLRGDTGHWGFLMVDLSVFRCRIVCTSNYWRVDEG